jgi:hypothetical protein
MVFDIDPNRIMEVNDVSEMIFAASKLSSMAVVEDIVMRPQLGGLVITYKVPESNICQASCTFSWFNNSVAYLCNSCSISLGLME